MALGPGTRSYLNSHIFFALPVAILIKAARFASRKPRTLLSDLTNLIRVGSRIFQEYSRNMPNDVDEVLYELTFPRVVRNEPGDIFKRLVTGVDQHIEDGTVSSGLHLRQQQRFVKTNVGGNLTKENNELVLEKRSQQTQTPEGCYLREHLQAPQTVDGRSFRECLQRKGNNVLSSLKQDGQRHLNKKKWMKGYSMKPTDVPVDDPPLAKQTPQLLRKKDANESFDEDPVCAELPMPLIAHAMKPGPRGQTGSLLHSSDGVACSSRPSVLYFSQEIISL